MAEAPHRKYHRRHLIFYLRAYEKGSDEVLGYLVDISEDGLMLMSNKPIETNKVYDLRVKLVSPVAGKSEIHFTAKCLWCKHTVNEDIFDAGFQYESIEPRAKKVIEDVIEEIGLQD